MSSDRAELAGPDNLVLVEQENRDACRGDQLVYLRPALIPEVLAVQRLTEVSRIRCASSRTSTSSLFRSAAMKSLKYLNSLWVLVDRAPADLPQRLCERSRSRRVNNGPAPSSQLAHEGQSDDALAAARPAGHQHDALVVAAPRLLDLVQHEVEGQSLLAKQDELLTVLDLVGRDRRSCLLGAVAELIS